MLIINSADIFAVFERLVTVVSRSHVLSRYHFVKLSARLSGNRVPFTRFVFLNRCRSSAGVLAVNASRVVRIAVGPTLVLYALLPDANNPLVWRPTGVPFYTEPCNDWEPPGFRRFPVRPARQS